MKVHDLKKAIAIGILVAFTWTGVSWATEQGIANTTNVAEEKPQVLPELPPGVKTVELATLSDKMTVKDLNELKSKGRSFDSAKVVTVSASEAEIRTHLNANPGLIETLNEKGIFLLANNGKAIELSSRPQTYFAGTGIAYVAYHGVVLEITADKSVVAFNCATGKPKEIHALLSDPLAEGLKGLTVDAELLAAVYRVVGVNSVRDMDAVTRFLGNNFRIGLSYKGKIVEDFVQYVGVWNEKTGERGFMMVTGQGYNLAQVGNKWYFGKSFDLVDAKTLLTDPQYAAMAKEILTNTKLLAQSVLNVVGSWMKLYYPEDLAGASKEILDLLNYDASKIPPEGVELRLENGKVNLVTRTKGNGS